MRRTMLFIIHMWHVDKQEQRHEGTHLTLQLSDQSWDTHQQPTPARPHSNPHLECHLPNAVRFPESQEDKKDKESKRRNVSAERTNRQEAALVAMRPWIHQTLHSLMWPSPGVSTKSGERHRSTCWTRSWCQTNASKSPGKTRNHWIKQHWNIGNQRENAVLKRQKIWTVLN